MPNKSDGQLQDDVVAELEWDPSVDHADIGVSVNDGVVTLAGYVKSFPQKVAAERAVRRVAGVRALAEELKVRFASDPKTADQVKPLLPRVEDAFQVFMRELRPSDLDGSAGMYRLKEELLRRVNVTVYPAKVDAVLFKELLLQ